MGGWLGGWTRRVTATLGRLLVVIATAVLCWCGSALLAAENAAAHRNACHRARSCPSDHATYRWRGLLCVSPNAAERTSAFTLIYVQDRHVYYCKR
jgi:hypothetical protein